MNNEAVKICRGCPHWAECAVYGECLTDIAEPFVRVNQFSRWMLPAQARAFEAGLRAGKSVRDLTNGGLKLGHAVCSMTKWRNHCEAYPLWASEMKALADANAIEKNKLKGAHNRNDGTHCRKGHLLPKEANYLGRGGKPYRRCVECVRIQSKRAKAPARELIERAIMHLAMRRPISFFTKGGSPGYLMSHKNFTAARALYPELDKLALDAIENGVSRAQKRRQAGKPKLRAQTKPKCKRSNVDPVLTGSIAARPDETHAAIDAVVPRALPPEMRRDVINDMWLAVADGEISIGDLTSQVKKFTVAYNRMFPQKYAMPSIDAPAFRDGATPLIETISEGLWH